MFFGTEIYLLVLVSHSTNFLISSLSCAVDSISTFTAVELYDYPQARSLKLSAKISWRNRVSYISIVHDGYCRGYFRAASFGDAFVCLAVTCIARYHPPVIQSTTSDLRPSSWGCIDCSVNLSAKASLGDVRCLIMTGMFCRGCGGSLIVYPYIIFLVISKIFDGCTFVNNLHLANSMQLCTSLSDIRTFLDILVRWNSRCCVFFLTRICRCSSSSTLLCVQQ